MTQQNTVFFYSKTVQPGTAHVDWMCPSSIWSILHIWTAMYWFVDSLDTYTLSKSCSSLL